MKVLWVVNTPIDILGLKLYGKKTNGVWMDALLSDYRKHGGFDLSVATSAKIKKTLCFENDGVRFFALPDNLPAFYDANKPSNISVWKDLIKKEKPDLVQIWGTEFSHGLCAIRACKTLNTPSVIYMQGYLGSIARYYLAGISEKEIRKALTLRDIIKHDGILHQQKKYYKSAKREAEEFSLCGRIICENEWCVQSVMAVSPDIKVYNCPLSINETFAKEHWSFENCEKHSIICNASGYPLKGLHILLQSVSILKQKYPDIKLYVPGQKMISDNPLASLLRKRGYTKYIEKLIKRLGIEENVIWLGPLPQEKLVKQYLRANVFVLCSSIENHSSSLKEAMIIGLPCVASAVGGIPEYVKHNESGLLYRFEEYDVLALYIEKIFENNDLAEDFSSIARKDMLKLHKNHDVFSRITSIYHEILNEG